MKNLFAELFPKKEIMVSAVFEQPVLSPPVQPKPPVVQAPLKLTDEQIEELFPKQKVMVSMLFQQDAAEAKSADPEAKKAMPHDVTDYDRTFPIV